MNAWLGMSGAKSYAPFLHVERAELARLTDDEATRQRELREAQRLLLAIGAPIRAAEVDKIVLLARDPPKDYRPDQGLASREGARCSVLPASTRIARVGASTAAERVLSPVSERAEQRGEWGSYGRNLAYIGNIKALSANRRRGSL
jgi:hypothetical protein